MSTAAHEIGHVLVGFGHPDDPHGLGKAPLPGTDVERRLMASGGALVPQGKLLVKKEWDEAEKWLKYFIDGEQAQ